MFARFALLVLVVAACGRHPMRSPGRDGALVDHPPDVTSTADEKPADDPTPDLAAPAEIDAATDQLPLTSDGPDRIADACVPLLCNDPTCFSPYCGDIGDGCGGTLHCGDCAPGWTCLRGQCFLTSCRVTTCLNPTPFQYCGRIGDGCGGALECACPAHGWVCVDHICKGAPAECVPIACSGSTWQYCGDIGDGCGGTLACHACSGPGFVCRDNVCVDTSDGGRLPEPNPPPPPLPPPPPPPAPCPPPPPPE